MARQEIDLTTPQPNGKMGEPTKSAWGKVNDMTLELYASQGDMIVGNYANRPDASTVAGRIYYAIDVHEMYTPAYGGWLLIPSGGTELGYAERTSTASFSSTTFAAIPGMSITFKIGENPAFVRYRLTASRGVSGAGVIGLVVDGAQVSQSLISSTGFNVTSDGFRISGKTPGTQVTVLLEAKHSDSGQTLTVFGDPIDKPYIQVTTC